MSIAPERSGLSQLIRDCLVSLHWAISRPLLDFTYDPSPERIHELLTAYDAVCKTGYRDFGNDCFANAFVQHGTTVESSYSRLVVALSAKAIGRVLWLVKAHFNDRQPASHFADIERLEVLPDDKIGQAAGGEGIDAITSEYLSLLSQLVAAEHEIVDQRHRVLAAMLPGTPAQITVAPPNPPRAAIDELLLREGSDPLRLLFNTMRKKTGGKFEDLVSIPIWRAEDPKWSTIKDRLLQLRAVVAKAQFSFYASESRGEWRWTKNPELGINDNGKEEVE